MNVRFTILRSVLISVLLLVRTGLLADTYMVTNTDDSGAGSLRQAITDANNHAGPDVIEFNIPASDPNYFSNSGVWTIQPTYQLPIITDEGLVIDGGTQSINYGTDTNPEGPEIELNGSLSPNFSGLYVTANGVEIYELTINRFSNGMGICMKGVEGGIISGCYIGTDAKGMKKASNGMGIRLISLSNHVLITPRGDKPNIISGNPNRGIGISGSSMHNVIMGNIIGLNRMCQDTLGNGVISGYGGICIEDQSDSNQVFDNWICGNNFAGINIYHSSGNIISNNFIGTEDWSQQLGNTYYGVWIHGDPTNPKSSAGNTIQGNHIGYSGFYGVIIEGSQTLGNRITENFISANTSYGILLTSGGNADNLKPTILTATDTEVTGQAGSSQTIEVFCDDDDEGKIILGVTPSDGSGNFSLTLPALPALSKITATATDSAGNTSMFSDAVVTSVHRTEEEKRPWKFGLSQNYPNPFNGRTTIHYHVPKQERVILKIYNTFGQEIRTLTDEVREAGKYEVIWDGKNGAGIDLATGLYMIKLKVGKQLHIKKMLMMK